MVEYSKINCKLTNVQLNKLKKAVKSNERATLRLGIKNFNKYELLHELKKKCQLNFNLILYIDTENVNIFQISKNYIMKFIKSIS